MRNDNAIEIITLKTVPAKQNAIRKTSNLLSSFEETKKTHNANLNHKSIVENKKVLKTVKPLMSDKFESSKKKYFGKK